MDDQGVGDGGYSDDDLDALPDNAFDELQQLAIESTQRPIDRARLPEGRPGLQSAADSPAGDTRPSAVGQGTLSYPKGPLDPSSDYGDIDDEMLDGEIFDGREQPALAAKYERRAQQEPLSESSRREQFRRQRYSEQSPSSANIEGQQQQKDRMIANALSNQRISERHEQQKAGDTLPVQSRPAANEASDDEPVKAQVQRLLSEREALRRAIQNANDIAFAKSGEIAIVRANASKAEKELEGRVRVLQAVHADELARQKAEIEMARGELQKVATEKRFLENDLAEGTKQVRNLQKAINKGNDKTSDSRGSEKRAPLTPRKSKPPMADGFNDQEVLPMSPSKLAMRNKIHTPKVGAKRKRNVADASPVKPLELVQPAQEEIIQDTTRREEEPKPYIDDQMITTPDVGFQFIQKILNHRIEMGHERTIEALANFRLPSQSDKALSTLLYDRMLMLGGGTGATSLPAATGLVVVSLWAQCLKDQYLAPVHFLIDLVNYILLLSPIRTAPELTDSLMGLVQETADIIIIPRCQKKPQTKDCGQITSLACLQIMYMMAQDCSVDKEEITRLWRTVRFDFIMMLLSFIHPLEELQIAISLLQTSILENSFAMIIPPGDGKQDATEARILDNLSRLLVEGPRSAQGEIVMSPIDLAELRLEILDLMDGMCDCTHGSTALAEHRLIIGRLVRVMNDELDRAYDYTYEHDQRIALVNAATRLLYFLTSIHQNLIDMQVKLSVIPGGEKKFLIALTRLAFSEGGFLENGIEDDVVDQAHQMLEMRVSPVEAEQLVGAFASAQTTRKSSKEPVNLDP